MTKLLIISHQVFQKWVNNANLSSVNKSKESLKSSSNDVDTDNWMYQSINATNDVPWVSSKLHYLFNDNKENQSPNYKQKQFELDNVHIEDFLRNKKLIPNKKTKH